jgi:hypothetical protein
MLGMVMGVRVRSSSELDEGRTLSSRTEVLSSSLIKESRMGGLDTREPTREEKYHLSAKPSHSAHSGFADPALPDVLGQFLWRDRLEGAGGGGSFLEFPVNAQETHLPLRS